MNYYYAAQGLSPESRKEVVAKVVEFLKDREFDAIAFRGVSGALIAPIVAYELDKPLIVVRKQGESNHSGTPCEGKLRKPFTYVIVDDFVASGHTVWSIVEELEPEGTCIGIYAYGKKPWHENHLAWRDGMLPVWGEVDEFYEKTHTLDITELEDESTEFPGSNTCDHEDTACGLQLSEG